MRAIVHFAADTDDSRRRIGGEGIDDRLRLRDRFSGRGENFVDRCDLSGVDRHLGSKAVAAGFFSLLPQSCFVSEVDIDGVDCRHASGGGPGDAKAARQTVRVEEATVLVTVGLGAEFGREVFRAPGERRKARNSSRDSSRL